MNMKSICSLILFTALLFGSGVAQAQTSANWTAWQVTSDSGIDVRYRREPEVWVSWSWQFRNRYNQKVIIHYTRLYGNGQRMETEIVVKPGDYGEDTNLGGDYNPAIQVTRVEFPDSNSSSGSSDSTSQQQIQQQQQQAALEQQRQQQQLAAQQAAIRQQQAELAAKQQAGLAKIQSYQNASTAVQNAGNQLSMIFQQQQAQDEASRQQAELDRKQERLERQQEKLERELEEANKTPEQRAAEEEAKQREWNQKMQQQQQELKQMMASISGFVGTWELDLPKSKKLGQLKLWRNDSGTLAGSGEFKFKYRSVDEYGVNSDKYTLEITSVGKFEELVGGRFGHFIDADISGNFQDSSYSRTRYFDDPYNPMVDLCQLLFSPILLPLNFIQAERTNSASNGGHNSGYSIDITTDRELYLECRRGWFKLKKVSN
jgi:hypothetical protein